MDTLLIILVALTTVAIPTLTEIAAAAHIFDDVLGVREGLSQAVSGLSSI